MAALMEQRRRYSWEWGGVNGGRSSMVEIDEPGWVGWVT